MAEYKMGYFETEELARYLCGKDDDWDGDEVHPLNGWETIEPTHWKPPK